MNALHDLVARATGHLRGPRPGNDHALVRHALRTLTRPDRFSALLPHNAYLPDNGLFVLDSGARHRDTPPQALGFVIEMPPQTGATEEMIKILVPLFGDAPVGARLQVSLYASSDIRPRIQHASLIRGVAYDTLAGAERRSSNVYRVLMRRRASHYLAHTRVRPVPHMPCLIRDFRLVLAVQLAGSPQDSTLVDALVKLREAMHATLKAAGFAGWNWGPADLIGWCRALLNPDKQLATPWAIPAAYDPGRLLRHQMVDIDTLCAPSDDGKSLRYGQSGAAAALHSRLYIVNRYPAEFPLWGMGNLIGDFYQQQLGYACPFVLTMGVHILDSSKRRDGATLRGARATTNASSQMARFMPQMQGVKADWDTVNRSYADGLGEIEMYHQLLLMAPAVEIETAEMAATALWNSRGFSLVSQQYMQVPALLTSIPLGFTGALSGFYRRTGLVTRKVTRNAVNLAPALAEWKGTDTPVIQLVGRRGQLMGLDLFDNTGGNYNFAVAASSGSGKSALANEITTGYLGIGGQVKLIDIGRSYEKICSHFGGQFIEFTLHPRERFSMNPFDQIVDIGEDMEMLKPLVAQMASPSGTLTDHDRSLLEIAILAAWRKEANGMTVDDIVMSLRGHRDRDARRLADQLFPYSRDGMYARYFEGPCTIDFANDLVVLELEELNTKKDLQSVALFIMMFRITQDMYRQRRDRRKLCATDEAWDLMAGANSGRFIEEGYRRARKYGGAFGTLTQSVEDYYHSPAAQAALQNADWLFLLRQKEESIEKLATSGRLKVDDATKRILMSLKTEQGLYADIFVSSPMGRGVGRLLLDPFSLLAYSTAPQDWRAVEHYRERGMPVAAAIEAVLRDRAVDAGASA
ncbi:conjugal transfer ATP-binding protein TraC [Pseudoduganella lurida]|uniref:Conjugal transfer ATP-binding protein TraC n=1 Tax=Pseudoduganella lurida TaxID=1036180 RepID=A0A562RJQ4_9BURK|nr:type IV secretion system protein TraC [Pseudoduganella lurida]TWI69292.1 conjugal transfer ATP-binding protein TraC [Pseudoduganella lurida]